MSPTTPQLVHAFGFCGAGFQIGPAVGEALAELIITAAPAFHWTPSRSPIQHRHRFHHDTARSALTMSDPSPPISPSSPLHCSPALQRTRRTRRSTSA